MCLQSQGGDLHWSQTHAREGIKPDDVNVRVIEDMPAPTDKKGVERLLGTANNSGKFIPNLATATEPIRVLLRTDIAF